MKLGIIARSEPRGLGNQSYEACRHLDPDRVLLIDPGPDDRFVQQTARYTQWDTTTARWNAGRLDPAVVQPWLDGLDVVYTAEAFYDDRLPAWAAQLRVGVAVHVNPEFHAPRDGSKPVTWWAPTPWRLDHLPSRARVVPMPLTQAPFRQSPAARIRFLHVAGWPAVADRNGTGIVAEAAGFMSSDAEVIIRGQHDDINRYRRYSPRLRVEAGNVANYWDLYKNADVLVMPRRFGGLCLPCIEAMAVGLPVVMSDCSPNEVWPGPRVPVTTTDNVATRAGLVPLHDVDPRQLANTLDELAGDAEALLKLQREATEWATANSWSALKDLWLTELESCLVMKSDRGTPQ